MKELLIPYILLCWLMFKFGIVARRPRNYFIATLGGVLLTAALFFGHRLWSPSDLTDSTQIKAPHSVLSPAIGHQIQKIHVGHNQEVKKGEILYTLDDTASQGRVATAEAKLAAAKASVEARTVSRDQAQRRLSELLSMEHHVSRGELRDAREQFAIAIAELAGAETQVAHADAELSVACFELEQLTIRAPHDGMITHVYIAEGSRIGALHLWDTSQKFVEMRVPDQAYRNLRPGQFAEFYVDAYPGEVFRARVHSIVKATGESQGSLLPQEQAVRNHIALGSLAVGRTVILEFEAPEGYDMPIGATGGGWISADKPHSILGFIDIIGGATVRLQSIKSYLGAL